MTIALSVFGLGYVGCVSSACFAREGHQVVGVDVSPLKVDMIKSGRPTIVENGIGELVAEMVAAGRLTATTDAAVVLMPGRRRLEFVCDGFGLQPGIYAVGASIRDRHAPVTIDWWYGTRLLDVKPGKSVRGYFYAPHQWRWADAPDGQRRPADV